MIHQRSYNKTQHTGHGQWAPLKKWWEVLTFHEKHVIDGGEDEEADMAVYEKKKRVGMPCAHTIQVYGIKEWGKMTRDLVVSHCQFGDVLLLSEIRHFLYILMSTLSIPFHFHQSTRYNLSKLDSNWSEIFIIYLTTNVDFFYYALNLISHQTNSYLKFV